MSLERKGKKERERGIGEKKGKREIGINYSERRDEKEEERDVMRE